MRVASFFAGIGGFDLAFQRAGHEIVYACEYAPFPREVYKQRFGHYPQGVDITDVKAEEIPEADIWVGGPPCQSLSVAGKRAGMQEGSGTTSSMFWTWWRLAEIKQPKYMLYENVPGVFSSNGGRDFQQLLSAFAGVEVPMPRYERWATSGFIKTDGVEVAWAVLDAQYFGVAQRRKRVFVVRSIGDISSCQILFEREGMRGDIAKGGEAGREIARSLITSPDKGRADVSTYVVGAYTPKVGVDISHAIRSGASRADKPTSTTYVIGCRDTTNERPDGALKARDYKGVGFDDVEAGKVVVETPKAFAKLAGTQRSSEGCYRPLEVVGRVFVAPPAQVCATLQASGAGTSRPAGMASEKDFVIVDVYNSKVCSGVTPTLSAQTGSPDATGPRVLDAGLPRRLTPIECERLQGFPDSWTAIDKAADGNRYKALGNAVAVPVIEWIARRMTLLSGEPMKKQRRKRRHD